MTENEPEAYRDDTLRSIGISPRERLAHIEAALKNIDEKLDIRFDSVELRLTNVERAQEGQASTAEFVAEAKKLLEQAGVKPGAKFSFTYNTSEYHKKMAVFAASEWKTKLGLSIDTESVEFKVLLKKRHDGDYQMARNGWVADYNDAYTYLYLLETRTGPQNYPGYSSPAYDRLMESSTHERDAVVRADIMRRAEQVMLDDCPVVPVGFGTSKNLIDPRIRGFEGNLEDIHRSRWMTISA